MTAIERGRIYIFPVVTLLAGLFFFSNAKDTFKERRNLLKAIEPLPSTAPLQKKIRLPSPGIESQLSQLAKTAGIQRLLSVGTNGASPSNSISLEWEGSQQSLIQWMGLLASSEVLGPCESLLITAAPQSNDLLHVNGIFQAQPNRSNSTEFKTALNPPKLHRNIFAPLWNKAASPQQPTTQKKREVENALQLQQKKIEQAQIALQEIQMKQEKKRAFETQWGLTGIVNNGKEPLAFINSQNTEGKTMMARKGDLIDSARITDIDEKNGEVRLDSMGQFQVVLKLTPHSTGSNP